MAPSAADRLSPPRPEISDTNLQPFFVLHEASSSSSSSSSSGKKSNRRSRTEPSPAESNHDQRLLMESSFDLVWSKIESTVKDVLKNVNSKAFHQIHSWVCESFATLTSSETIHSKRLFTGLVLTKHLDFLDDLMTFKELALHLKSNGCHVASLSPLDFFPKNGIGGCLRSLLKQFLATTLDAPDLSVLSSWYREQGSNAPVVVIIDDLERCCGSLLSDFILMLSEWIHKVPVILIAGVATLLEFPRNMVRSNSLQCLCPSKFTLGTSAERMDAIVEAILAEPCAGFCISHKVAGFMRNNFMNQDGTITSFLRALKMACVQHFFSEPLSFMLRGFIKDDLQEFKDGFSGLLLEEIPKDIFDSLCNERGDGKNVEELIKAVLEVKKLLRRWSMVVMCLYDAGKYGKITLLDLLCEALNPEVWKSRVSDTCKKKLEDSEQCPSADCSLHTLRSQGYIAQALYKVRDLPLSMLHNLLKSWEHRTMDMQEIHNKVKKLQHMLKSERSRRTNEESMDIERRHKSRPSSTTVKVSRNVNEMAASYLEDLIKDYMQPIECISSHEIVCYKKVDKLQMALISDPRRQIQVDLLEVSKTMCCPCCPRTSNSPLPSMHNTSILYTLSQEHGDLINICDWYQSFKSILNQPSSKKKHAQKQSPASKKRKVDEVINTSEVAAQAQFCRAVAELQITGLLRMQSRRRLHFLQRVAFGL